MELCVDMFDAVELTQEELVNVDGGAMDWKRAGKVVGTGLLIGTIVVAIVVL